MRLSYAILARRDLSAIWSYIAQDSPASADATLVRLDDACHALLTFPDRGRAGLQAGTRELAAVRPYVIIYAVLSGTVDILRIRHSAERR